MKKKYESYSGLVIMFCLLMIGIILLIIFLFNRKIVLYKVFNGVVYNEDILVLVLSDEELKLFNKNKKVLIENKSKDFKIMEIVKEVLERDGEKYNQVFLKINISNMYKVNDVVSISIKEKSVGSYKIFKIIGEGD